MPVDLNIAYAEFILNSHKVEHNLNKKDSASLMLKSIF